MDKSKTEMNKLADKGWGSMSQILDREMPLRKDRKRFLLWFFLLTSLLIVASYLIYQSSTNSDKLEKSNEPIAINESNVQPVHKISEVVIPEKKENAKESKTVYIDKPIDANSTVISKVAMYEESVSKYDSDIVPVIELVSQEMVSTQLSRDLQIDFESVESAEAIESMSKEVSTINLLRNVKLLSSLARIDCDLFASRIKLKPAKYSVLETENLIVVEDDKSRIRSLLGLSVSWTTDGFFTGYGAGYDLQVPLSKRLFVLGGVSFHSYKTNDQANPSFSFANSHNGAFEDVEGPEIEAGSMDENDLTNVESIRKDLDFNNFNTIDFHIGFGLEITNNLGFWIGGNLKQVFSIDQPNFEPSLAPGEVGSSLNSNSMFINPKIGMYYDVMDRLRLAIHFERGFKHVYYDTNSIVEFDPLSFTNLKVAYSF